MYDSALLKERIERLLILLNRIRLGRFFEMKAQFWMNLQGRYELEMAREQLGQRLWSEVRVYLA
ncbi:MAG: hypothetical protein ACO3NK_02700 [Prochlorotrichaceae cyanobacterium]|jgi:plasmid maintenance system antidote protein VapI